MAEIVFEVCANSLQSAMNAEEGGAHRVELCADLPAGGITPSAATIMKTIKTLRIPVFVMIRPRPGNFVYNDFEFEIMKEDIAFTKRCGAKGVVFGLLTEKGKIDMLHCTKLVKQAYPMECTFHMAFDRVADMNSALEEVIKTGAHRILTSGLSDNAFEGKHTLKKLIEQAAGRIIIMAGKGLTPSNVADVIKQSGVNEVHASCSAEIPDNFINHGNTKENLFKNTITNLETVKKFREAIDKL